MGLFDVPGPLFSWLDARLALAAGDLARLMIWAAIAAALSMGLYGLVSPQARLAALKQDIARYRREVADAQAVGHDALLIQKTRAMVVASLGHVGLTLGPTLIAALPVLCILAWVSNAFSYVPPPPGSKVAASIYRSNETVAETVVSWPPELRPAAVIATRAHAAVPVSPVIHKRMWWNALVGNPLGYLAAGGDVERIEFALPQRRYLPRLPGWLAGWEAVFLTTMLAVSLAMKFGLRLH